MNIRITEKGYLEIDRAGTFAPQYCPYSSERCGSFCPLFGEPREWTGGEDGMALGLCQGTLIGHIEDLRGKP